VRRRSVQRMQAQMAFAEPFGAVVIVGSMRGADGDLDVLESSLRACASFGSVPLALEPLNRYESRLLNTAASAVEMIDRVGCSNVGILFDTFHANIEEPDPTAAIAEAGSRLLHVHLADSNRWIPGHGHVRFDAVWKALTDIGYARSVVLEPILRPSAEALLRAGSEIRSSWPAEA